MAFSIKTWFNNPGGGTKLNAAGLNDLEARISAGIAAAGGGDTILASAPTGVAATDNANLQAGLTAAAGGSLQMRDGSYNITAAMAAQSFTTVLGDKGTTIATNYTGIVFPFSGLNSVRFVGMRMTMAAASSTLFQLDGAFGCSWSNCYLYGSHSFGSPKPNQIGIDNINNTGDCWFTEGSSLNNFGKGTQTASYAVFFKNAKVTNCQYGAYFVPSYSSGIVISDCSFSSLPGGTTLSQVYIPGAAGYCLLTATNFEGANNTIVAGNGTLFQGPTHLGITNCHVAGSLKILDIQSAYGVNLNSISFTADPGTTPTTLTINPVGAPDNGFAAGLITNVAADADTIAASVFPPNWTYFGRTQSQIAGFTAAANIWQPTHYGQIAWAYDPALAINTSVPTAGTISTVRLKLGAAASITNVVLYVQTGGATLTAGQCFAAIYQGGTLIGVTADQATAWQSSGSKVMPLVGGPFAVAAGDLVVAFYSNGSTQPNFSRASFSGAGNLNLTLAGSRFGTADTGRTTSMPGTLGTITADSNDYWAGVS